MKLSALMQSPISSITVDCVVVPRVFSSHAEFPNLTTVTIDWPFCAEHIYYDCKDPFDSDDSDADEEDPREELSPKFYSGSYDDDLIGLVERNASIAHLRACEERSGRKFSVFFTYTSFVETDIPAESECLKTEISFKLDVNKMEFVEKHFGEMHEDDGRASDRGHFECFTGGDRQCSLCVRDVAQREEAGRRVEKERAEKRKKNGTTLKLRGGWWSEVTNSDSE